ncbi:hypothetical protein P8C59_007850 [Phyllachora maydis]|uniref:Casein kinase II beta 2 subunit n=1 Tax=Phyllachora maydis TaxID=1825666 RepID=A0AAD9MG04_9PEZI|nr:hypothetical protein P8C59_007850 [Phyllachora maydis]
MPPAGGMWAMTALRVFTRNVASTTKQLRAKFATATATRPLANDAAAHVQIVHARAHVRQTVHPVAWARQQKRAAGTHWSARAGIYIRHAVRHLSSSSSNSGGGGARAAPVLARASAYAVCSTGRAVARLAGRAPFASALRPNLTGGALPRTAGGYTLGGGSRYFSHAPAAPAHVVHNVGVAMRAFCLAGQRARYDGAGADGCPRFRAVSAAQEEARLRVERAAGGGRAHGSFVDFRISPVVTALSPLGGALPFATVEGFGVAEKAEAGAATLNMEGFLDVLSVDFARALNDLAAVMADLKKLAALGDLPIAMGKGSTVLRVRFPGVDADAVERLCDDMGVSRGVVHQDAGFDTAEAAFRFPCAPSEASAKASSSPGGSLRSHDSELSELEEDQAFLDEFENNPWFSSDDHEGHESTSPPVFGRGEDERRSGGSEGLEGLHRFLAECVRARGQYRT